MTRLLPFLLLPLASYAVSAPVPKEDGAAEMRRIYGVTVDPEEVCKFESKDGSLRITLPNYPRLLSPWSKVFNAPRVWREVTGDFTVALRVSFPIRPMIPPKHQNVTQSRASGGLVVWADDDDFVTVTRDERETDGEPAEFFRAEANCGGRARGYAEYRAPAEFGYLQLQRKGKEVTSHFSSDGKKWKPLFTFEAGWSDAVKVGVVAENSYNAEFTATFTEYTLTVPKK
jgi:regulation of enolase protein 1 (concanavalin A-like superfamily)